MIRNMELYKWLLILQSNEIPTGKVGIYATNITKEQPERWFLNALLGSQFLTVLTLATWKQRSYTSPIYRWLEAR